MALLLTLTVPLAVPASAHSGGLNSEGCHKNRKTGDYHCHLKASKSAGNLNVLPALGSGAGRPFRNCTAARAAGAAPVFRGDPG
ncbi:YHYH domain-containing protein [Aestuariivirga sp.]|uniref:YHYH domain-containing protein n=1 Tax=Aestuariivirga sp. TaxID=2650926 RepID=UPI0025BD0BB0|nr:YHYH domain-containing protein [Aestuariivirga sp.]MCA3555270.1 YHYH domain-containing protein [Aestuariivirga sp.]